MVGYPTAEDWPGTWDMGFGFGFANSPSPPHVAFGLYPTYVVPRYCTTVQSSVVCGVLWSGTYMLGIYLLVRYVEYQGGTRVHEDGLEGGGGVRLLYKRPQETS